ncbi:MAG TPA: SH3 domain-containing protein [bacterium]|nr:SH3 domain-containing protein [bacterium]HQP99494.1 SH3 domain-containing protein [bacterium]
MMKRLPILLFLAIELVPIRVGVAADLPQAYDSCSGNRGAIFRLANSLYEQGQLAQAEAGYQFLLDMGVRNGYLYYNLANTRFRKGQLGPAILEYERALQYLPRNRDIRHNLEFVRNLMVDEELKPVQYGGTMGFIIKMHSLLNLRENLLGLALLLWMTAILYAWGALCPDSGMTRRTGWLRVTLLVLLLFGVLSAGIKIYQNERQHRAIILVAATEVRTGPGEDYSAAFSLHEGTAVKVESKRPDWVQIRLPNGFTGWLPGKDLEVI